MYRIIVAICILALVLIGCTAQATPTPTPSPEPTATPIVPTDTPTATLLPPTATPSPTPITPTAVPTAVPITGSVIARLNVRQSPSLTGKQLGILNKDDAVTLLGRTTDNAWLQIYYPITQTTTNGWVVARLVQTSPLSGTLATFNLQGTPAPAGTQVATGPTSAATGPTTAATSTVIATGGTSTPTTPVATNTPKPTATSTPGGKASGSIIFDTFESGTYQINKVHADGSGLTVLFSGASEPALSPNGQELAYHKRNKAGGGGAGLAIAALDGSNERIIVGSANAGYPTWSPDGNNLVYDLTPSGNTPGMIYRIAIGSPTDNPLLLGLGVRPAWRPGDQTALFDGCDGSGGNCYSLHTENAFTPNPTAPVFVVKGTNGAWSPNGSQIAFQDTDSSGNINVFVANRDGSNKRQVTKGTGHNGLPVWSADGQWLFYRTDQNGTSWAIYAIRLDGSSAYKIADAPVNADDWVYEKLAIAP
ncbi:MAG: SH3 domain-containing protein [Anaerolineae bacterium]